MYEKYEENPFFVKLMKHRAFVIQKSKSERSIPFSMIETYRMFKHIIHLTLLTVFFSWGMTVNAKDESTLLFGQFPAFSYPAPASQDEWETQKPMLRKKLRRLLGDLPPLFTPKPLVAEGRKGQGYSLHKFYFDNRAGAMVFGYLVIPEGRTQPGPALIFHHQHAGDYPTGKEEILRAYITDDPPAKVLADEGYVVMCIDAYGFGERQAQGPAGEKDEGGQTEAALFKTFLWEGRTLWGMMVRDDMLALNYLLSRTDLVDPQRVGALGMSMGSTRTWWLAALDERVSAAVCVACLTRYQDLIESGKVNAHGVYYFVPNLLKEGIDMEAVVALIAPRPLLTLTGDKDGGSPVSGVNFINQFVAGVYEKYGQSDRFKGVVYPNVGHQYTVEMWNETIHWFDQFLKNK